MDNTNRKHPVAVIKINNCLDCGALSPFPDKKWKIDVSKLLRRVDKEHGYVEIAWICNKTGKTCCWQKQSNDGGRLTFIPIPKFCPFLITSKDGQVRR